MRASHASGYDQGLDKGGPNAVTAAEIKAAVGGNHVQGTDQTLDDGGADEVAVADIRDAVDVAHVAGADTSLGEQGEDLDMGGNQIVDLGEPGAASDAATRGYVDAALNGLSPKSSVRAATTAALTLATDCEVGDKIDNVTLVLGDRILVKNQGSAENGIYVVKATGAPDRAADMAAASDASGAYFVVVEGDTNGDVIFLCTNDKGEGIVGTDTLAFGDRGKAVGDFVGPAGAVPGNLVEFDGATGTLGKDSGLATETLEDHLADTDGVHAFENLNDVDATLAGHDGEFPKVVDQITDPTLYASWRFNEFTPGTPEYTPDQTLNDNDLALVNSEVVVLWDPAREYSTGERCWFATHTYVALRTTEGDQPDVSGDDWSQEAAVVPVFGDGYINLPEDTGGAYSPSRTINWHQNFCIEGRFLSSDTDAATRYLFYQNQDITHRIEVFIGAGQTLSVRLRNGANEVNWDSGAQAIWDGAEHHWALTFKASTGATQFYWDGSRLLNGSLTGDAPTSTSRMFVGCYDTGGSGGARGTMDMVNVWLGAQKYDGATLVVPTTETNVGFVAAHLELSGLTAAQLAAVVAAAHVSGADTGLDSAGANALTAAEIKSGWRTLAASKYTATPTDTNTLAMSDTSGMRVGLALRYTISSVAYKGYVKSITTNTSIDVRGAPLGGNVTKLEVSLWNRTINMPVTFSGSWDASIQDLSVAIGKVPAKLWRLPAVKFVGVEFWSNTTDSGATKPQVSVKIGAELVLSAPLTITAAQTVYASEVDIDTDHYAVAFGDAVDIRCTTAGTNGDAGTLSADLVFILDD